MSIANITSAFGDKLLVFQSFSNRPALHEWKKELEDVISKLSSSAETMDHMLHVLHRAQRLLGIYDAGLEDNLDFYNALYAANLKSWEDFDEPPVSRELQERLAERLYNIDRINDPCAMVEMGDKAKHIMPYLVRRLMENEVPFNVRFYDPDFESLIKNHAGEEGVQFFAKRHLREWELVNTRMVARTTGAEITPYPEKNKIYSSIVAPIMEKLLRGEMYFTLTYLPTPNDARKEGMTYEDYTKLYFEMCDQPWEHIQQAQEILGEKFSQAKILTISNSDGTNIEFDLVDEHGEPFTFVNSVIAKNVPGSETFSSVRRDSANGTIVAKGNFLARHDPSKIIKNLTLEFKNGKIISFSADEGEEYFQEFLDRDPNNYYIGEIGFGTNPHLRKHLMNALLVEKINGSFHVALGVPILILNMRANQFMLIMGIRQQMVTIGILLRCYLVKKVVLLLMAKKSCVMVYG